MATMINQLCSKIAANQFEFSKHALDQSILRNITVQELCEAIANGEIIEDYPEDKYGPSCLVFGLTKLGRPIHIQCREWLIGWAFSLYQGQIRKKAHEFIHSPV